MHRGSTGGRSGPGRQHIRLTVPPAPTRAGRHAVALFHPKDVNGHSDRPGGIVVTNDSRWYRRPLVAQEALSLQPSPFDAGLTPRGQHTPALCIEWHRADALKLARRPLSAGSGMVTVELDCSAAQTFCRRLEHFTLAKSPGGRESLAGHPATVIHAAVPRRERQEPGLGNSLVRCSVGIEDVDQLRTGPEAACKEVFG